MGEGFEVVLEVLVEVVGGWFAFSRKEVYASSEDMVVVVVVVAVDNCAVGNVWGRCLFRRCWKDVFDLGNWEVRMRRCDSA